MRISGEKIYKCLHNNKLPLCNDCLAQKKLHNCKKVSRPMIIVMCETCLPLTWCFIQVLSTIIITARTIAAHIDEATVNITSLDEPGATNSQ